MKKMIAMVLTFSFSLTLFADSIRIEYDQKVFQEKDIYVFNSGELRTEGRIVVTNSNGQEIYLPVQIGFLDVGGVIHMSPAPALPLYEGVNINKMSVLRYPYRVRNVEDLLGEYFGVKVEFSFMALGSQVQVLSNGRAAILDIGPISGILAKFGIVSPQIQLSPKEGINYEMELD